MIFRTMTLLLAILTIVALPTAQARAATIYGCQKNTTGRITKISAMPPVCSSSQTAISWNQGGGTGSSAIVVHSEGLGFPNASPFITIGGGGVPAGTAYRLPRDGTIANLRIKLFSNTMNADAVLMLLVNGSATSLSAPVPAGSTTSIDVPSSVSASDGDSISVVLDASAVTSGSLSVSVAYEVQ